MHVRRAAPIRSRFLLRTFRYFLLIIFVPLLLVSSILVGSSWALTLQAQQTRVRERLESLSETVADALNTSHWIGANIANKRNIIPGLIAGSAQMQDELTRQLGAYRVSNGLYGDVIACYPQVPSLLFTSRGIISVDQLSPFFALPSDEDTYASVLNRIAAPTLLSAVYGVHSNASQTSNYFSADDLLYVTPVMLSSSHARYMTVLIVIDKPRLELLTSQAMKPWSGKVLMLSGAGRVVFSSDGDMPGSVLPTNGDALFSARTLGPDSVFAVGEEGDAIRLVFLSDTAALHAQVFENLRPMWQINSIAVLVGLLLCFGLALRAYWPVVRLERLRAAQPEQSGQEEGPGIETALRTILTKGNQVGNQIWQLNAAMQETLLWRVLNGDIENPAEIERAFSEARISLPGPQFVAMHARLSRSLPENSRYQLSMALHQEIDWPHGIVPVMPEESASSLLFIASLPASLDTEQNLELLQSVVRAALSRYDIEASLGVSHIKQSLSELREASLEAQSALMQSGADAGAPDFPGAAQADDDESPRQLAGIKACLSADDIQGASVALHQWFESEAGARHRAGGKRAVQLLDTVFESLIERRYLSPQRASKLLGRCVAMPTAQELEDRLIGILEALETEERPRHAEDDERLTARMLAYLDQYVFDPLFSMTMMADAFEMPVFSFGRVFKRCFGQTFIPYVSQRRIDRAKALLSQSDMNLKEIVETIGYVDVSNFIRKFKIIVGVTPGEYRKQHAGGEHH